jgi:hypothetical protein
MGGASRGAQDAAGGGGTVARPSCARHNSNPKVQRFQTVAGFMLDRLGSVPKTGSGGAGDLADVVDVERTGSARVGRRSRPLAEPPGYWSSAPRYSRSSGKASPCPVPSLACASRWAGSDQGPAPQVACGRRATQASCCARLGRLPGRRAPGAVVPGRRVAAQQQLHGPWHRRRRHRRTNRLRAGARSGHPAQPGRRVAALKTRQPQSGQRSRWGVRPCCTGAASLTPPRSGKRTASGTRTTSGRGWPCPPPPWSCSSPWSALAAGVNRRRFQPSRKRPKAASFWRTSPSYAELNRSAPRPSGARCEHAGSGSPGSRRAGTGPVCSSGRYGPCGGVWM